MSERTCNVASPTTSPQRFIGSYKTPREENPLPQRRHQRRAAPGRHPLRSSPTPPQTLSRRRRAARRTTPKGTATVDPSTAAQRQPQILATPKRPDDPSRFFSQLVGHRQAPQTLRTAEDAFRRRARRMTSDFIHIAWSYILTRAVSCATLPIIIFTTFKFKS